MLNLRKILFLVIVLISMLCVSCGTDTTNATKLSFKEAASYDSLKAMDGEYIQINGYMATSSPVDGSFMFLMNLPYQSCPFCIPNTSQLSNTIEVYPKKNNPFSYTSQAIKIVGKLEVSDDPNKPFTDDYGYEFNFKIVDATMKILKDSDLSLDIQTWQKIAQSGVISDIYTMYDYVYFTVYWPSYYVSSYYDEDGKLNYGYYLWASDAQKAITNENGQFHYGYVDNYFQNIISKIEKVDKEKFALLVSNVKKAQELASQAYADLSNGEYTSVKKTYDIPISGTNQKSSVTDDVYTLKNKETLEAKYNEIYKEFSNWLSSWEM